MNILLHIFAELCHSEIDLLVLEYCCLYQSGMNRTACLRKEDHTCLGETLDVSLYLFNETHNVFQMVEK